MPDFQRRRDRDLNLGSSHTAYRRASLVDLYTCMPNFIEIEETFCGRTDVRTYVRKRGTHVRTDVRTFETGFIRSTLLKIRPKAITSQDTVRIIVPGGDREEARESMVLRICETCGFKQEVKQ